MQVIGIKQACACHAFPGSPEHPHIQHVVEFLSGAQLPWVASSVRPERSASSSAASPTAAAARQARLQSVTTGPQPTIQHMCSEAHSSTA
ncbi:TPA: hypothetical protein ACH3X2_006183 [Trebouxia sp. C0005]